MFTGIIENLGQIAAITPDGGNVHFDVTSTLAPELKIDQSVAHDGCCLTVVALHGEGVPHGFRVTAIAETLDKTCLGTWSVGRTVNLERAALVGSRLDGHTVQGHVDSVGRVTEVSETNGSWRVAFLVRPPSEPRPVELRCFLRRGGEGQGRRHGGEPEESREHPATFRLRRAWASLDRS